MATSQSHEQVPSQSAHETLPSTPQVGFGDLKLREAEAEKTMAAAAKRLTSPEALVHTREQMIREQLEEVVKQVGRYGEDYNLVEGEDRQKFQERVKKSTLIKEVYQLMQQAYVEQDKISPLNYDKEQPYTIIKREYGFDLAPSQTLKSKFNTKSFNLEDYISELFPRYADDVQEPIKEPAKSEEPKNKNENVPKPVSDEAKARVEAAKADGTITDETIQSFDGYEGADGNRTIGMLTDEYIELENSDTPPELSYKEYVNAMSDAFAEIKRIHEEAGNTTSKNEDEIRADLKASFILIQGKIPTDEEVDYYVEVSKNTSTEAEEVRPTDEEIAKMEETQVKGGVGNTINKKETE